MADVQFQLKTAPPRIGRAVPARKRLEHRWVEIHDRTAIIVTAPQGFGKTTLLAQWRRNWLEGGAFVAWASLDAQDDRARFVNLLLFALRAATGRESFAVAATQSRLSANRELDALTELLAEVAVLATPLVVILDDVHRMPQAAMRELLAYLLNNAPPNLHFLIGSRRPIEIPLTDLMAAGRVAILDAGDLRLGLDESLDILRARFGTRIGIDDAVRLHELTEGWPLGLQLTASTIERASDLHEVIGQLSARRGDIHRFFFESLVSRLPPPEAAFLVRISILEVMNVDVCRAVTGCEAAATYLEALAHESPIMTEGEGRDWLRLHAMARDFLLGQFDKLPPDERRQCYERAAAWYADHGQYQDAARHSLAAGDDALAGAHASRCLLDIAREGRLAEAREWMRRLPSQAVSRDVQLQLTMAWVTALSDDASTVPALIAQIAEHPRFDDRCRFQAAVIKAAAGTFCDQPGLIVDALRGWDRAPPDATPLYLAALANSRANIALYEGETEKARQLLAPQLGPSTRPPGMRMALAFSDTLAGLSYVWEGNAIKAIAVLQPRLELAEHELGRRSVPAAMLAGVLAVARYLHDQPERALATLADRLDVIERVGMPDPLILAYRTLAWIACRRGDEARALDVFAALHEIGVTRDVPRMSLASLADQIQLHSLRGRAQTAAELLVQMAALQSLFEQSRHRVLLPHFQRMQGLSTAYVRLAQHDLAGADTALQQAVDTRLHMRRSVLTLSARALLALVAHERDQPQARDMLAEVLSLAALGGVERIIQDVHPQLADMLAPADAPGRAANDLSAGSVAATTTGGLLTPKEARILSLLAVGRSNKEIARAMDIGEQTVKWHLKNLFFKLNAGGRKHAVDRARLLGVLDG